MEISTQAQWDLDMLGEGYNSFIICRDDWGTEVYSSIVWKDDWVTEVRIPK